MTAETPSRGSAGFAWTLLTLAPLFWAGNIVIARAVHAEVPPIGLSFWRWPLAADLFLPFAWPRLAAQWPVIRREAGFILLLSFLGLGAFPILMYTGLQTTTALNASFIQAICPVAIPLIAWGLTGERISTRHVLGIAVSCVGAVAIVSAGDPVRLLRGGVTIGALWVLGAMLLWSVYSVIVRRRPADLDPNALLLATMVLAALMILPLWLWEAAQVKPMATSPPALLAVAYIVLFPSIGSYFCFNRGIDIVGPTKGGLCMHLVPLFGAVLAVLFLGEAFRPYHALGIALIFTGIVLVTRAGRPRQASPQAATD